jgi:hypothetical protein
MTTQDGFWSNLKQFGDRQLPAMAVQTLAGESHALGFRLVYHPKVGADLALDGKSIGRVSWKDGCVKFDPPLSGKDKSQTLDADLREWASLARKRLSHS